MKFHSKNLIAIFLTLSMSLSISAVSEIEITENTGTQVGLCEDFETVSQSELNEITADNENYDVFVLLRFDYPDLDLQLLEGLSKEERRDTVRDYYKTKNEQIAAELGLENISVSHSAPYAEIVYDSLEDYKESRTELVTAVKTDDVSYIGADIISVDNENVYESTSSSSVGNYPLSFALTDIGNVNNSYNGSGIKVGMLEGSIPTTSTNLPQGTIAATYGQKSQKDGQHPEFVASIIGGNTGIAKGVKFYCAAFTSGIYQSSEFSFTNCLNWLLNTKYVDIINMSAYCIFSDDYDNIAGTPTYLGKNFRGTVYTNFCAYVDYVTIYSSCLLVKSAGNRGLDAFKNDYTITKPGMAVNVLTVGATNIDWEVSYLSSYKENDTLIGKPEVVAPGENIVVPNIGTNSGTSFAAPMVTGIAAKLMHEFPELKTDMGMLKAVIMAGCDKLSSSDPIFSDKSGFGMISYTDSRAIMANKQYAEKTIIGAGRKNTVLYESAFSVTSGKTAAVRFSRAIEGQNCTPDSTVTSANMVKYRVNITHTTSSGTVTDASFVWDGTVGYYDIKNNTSSNITYKIKITPEDRMYDAMEYIHITHENASHEHHYYQFVSADSHTHSCLCICGHKKYETHTQISTGLCSKCGVIN